MNKLLPSLLCLFVLLFGASAASAQGKKPIRWRTFTSTDGRFKVALPGAPEQLVTIMKVKDRVFDQPKFSAAIGELYLLVTYYDNPSLSNELVETDRQLVYESERDSLVASLPGAKLGGERVFQYKGKQGREWTIKQPDGVSMRYRRWRVGSRLYQLVASYYSNKQNDVLTQSRIDRFMNSFEVLEH